MTVTTGSVPSELKTLIEVYRQRDDLIREFPEAVRGDFRRLLRWAVKYGITTDAARNVLEPKSDTYRKLLAQCTPSLGDEARLRLRKYLTGLGLDVGPLNCPFPEGRAYKILAVDFLTPKKMMEYFPQYLPEEVRFPDIVCNVEYFNVFRPRSFDFVIASHVLEHLPDPIGSIESLIRTLKPRGILILIIPDKEKTFDSGRPVTDLKHLLDIYQATPEERVALEAPHYMEVSQIVERRTSSELEDRAKQFEGMPYFIHRHVFDRNRWDEFVSFLLENYRLENVEAGYGRERTEFINVIRRT